MHGTDRVKDRREALQQFNAAMQAENWPEALLACRNVCESQTSLPELDPLLVETFRIIEHGLQRRVEQSRPLHASLADSRPVIFVVYIAGSVMLAGFYGFLHNLVSYAVSSEFFTTFLFREFRVEGLPVPPWMLAGYVGILGSWWMGLPLGVLAGAAGFLQRNPRQMRWTLLWSWLVLVGVAWQFGMLGMLCGDLVMQSTHADEYIQSIVPGEVANKPAFLRAGFMHNASYLGGVLGIPAAWVLHLCWRFGTSWK